MESVQIGHFTVDIAKDWELTTVILAGPIDESPGHPMLSGSEARSFRQNIVATVEQVSEKETPQSYLKRQVEGLERAGVGRREVSSPEPVKLKTGLAGILSEQDVVLPSGEWVRQMQVISIQSGRAYTLIASHLYGELYDKARSNFREMLLSLEVKEVVAAGTPA